MNELIPLRRPGAEVGDRHELNASFTVEDFALYGRHHEIIEAEADVGVTRLSEGLHLEFGDSVFLRGPNDRELSVRDWTLDLGRYTERALPSEVPMQVFGAGTEPVEPAKGGGEIDPRWRGLGGLFASNF